MYKIRKKDLSYQIILPGNKDTVMCIRLFNIVFHIDLDQWTNLLKQLKIILLLDLSQKKKLLSIYRVRI